MRFGIDIFGLKVYNRMQKLDGKYSERVQLPAKAKFRGFVDNTWQHLPHLLLEAFCGL